MVAVVVHYTFLKRTTYNLHAPPPSIPRYNVARTATVAALNDGAVWVLERPVFRTYIQEGAENKINELEVFLNSVPLLNSLNKEERIILADAMEEKKYEKDQRVITQASGRFLLQLVCKFLRNLW